MTRRLVLRQDLGLYPVFSRLYDRIESPTDDGHPDYADTPLDEFDCGTKSRLVQRPA